MNDVVPILTVFAMGLGLLGIVIGSIWFYIETFKEGIGWFFACLLFPPASIAFLFSHADRAFTPTVVIILGAFFVVLSSFDM